MVLFRPLLFVFLCDRYSKQGILWGTSYCVTFKITCDQAQLELVHASSRTHAGSFGTGGVVTLSEYPIKVAEVGLASG